MKILVIVDGFHPDESGGITNSLRLAIRGLVMRAHQVAVLTKRLNAWAPVHQRLDGYDLYRYFSPPRESAFYRAYPLFYFLALPRAARRLYQRNPFEIAYIQNPYQVVGFQRAGVDVPVIYASHAPTSEISVDAQGGKYGWLTPLLGPLRRFARALQKRALAQANLTLTFSQFMRREMEALAQNGRRNARFATVPLAVDTDRFTFAQDCLPARKALGLPADRPVLLTVRRLVARMGLENLIAAMEMIREDHPNALLLIGGAGYLKKKLEAQVKSLGLENYVRLLGFISEEQLPLYYQAADLFVLPTSTLEGFGVATTEALSCGTPVLGTPVGATPEILMPLGDEFLAPGASPEHLAQAIHMWLERKTSPELRRQCREYCVSRFSLTSVIPRLEQIFSQVAAQKQPCA